VNELISTAMSEPDEEHAYWDAVTALNWRGTREVLDRAFRLCQSASAVERRLGADILGQLGVPDRAYPKECLRILSKMLESEQDYKVTYSIMVALSHHIAPEAIELVLRFLHHADPDVRLGVVLALTGYESHQALDALINLTRDSEAQVRNWATFAIGSQVEVDTPQIRDALLDRVGDADDDTRYEALVGLARRGDRRVLPALHKELACESVSTLAIEAAALIGEPQLITELIALRGRWDGDLDQLEQAIRACSPGPPLAPSGTCDEVG
jgi:HEAT repeat protein